MRAVSMSISYHITSNTSRRIISSRDISNQIVSNHMLYMASYQIMSFHIIKHNVISHTWCRTYRIIPYQIKTYAWRHIKWISQCVVSYHVKSYRIVSYHKSRRIVSHDMALHRSVSHFNGTIPFDIVWPKELWTLEVKLPTIWTDGKAEVGRVREEKRREEKWSEVKWREEKRREEKRRRKKIREEKESEERVRGKKMQAREKVEKSRNNMCFQWFVSPEGRKVGSLKRRVRSHLAGWRKNCTPLWSKHMSQSKVKPDSLRPLLEVEVVKTCTPLWREAHFQVKMYKTHHSRSTLGSWDDEKVHTVVARSTFPSQNVQNAPGPEHFWKLRCRKSVRRCGAKHVSKPTC